MKKTLIVYFSATGNTKTAQRMKDSCNDLKNSYPQYTWGRKSVEELMRTSFDLCEILSFFSFC